MALTPPDPTRCQTMITPAYNPWRVAGEPRPRPERCPNKPVVIARERAPGKDGERGAMSLCAGCREQFVRQMPAGYATFTKIKEPA